MSLINDALKRAKQAQKNQPPAGTSGPQFRPAEPTPRKSNNLSWFLPLAIFIAMTLVILLVWSQSHKNDSRTIAQKPGVVNQSSPTASAASPPATALQTPAIPAKLVAPAPALKPVEPTPSAATPTAPPVTTQTSAPVAAAPVVAPTPKPAPPRLQAIFYNPQRPSAIIDGKTVMIGDKLGEFRVRAITQDSATLTSAAQTIVLTLE
jgi:hypothetical protein